MGRGSRRAARSVAVRFANWVASLAITPNQITLVGLVLVAFVCALFLYHQNTFIFGSSLIVAYLFDTLDGVVARAQGKSTPFGGYLDAVVDRYQEVATYLVIGIVTELWVATFLVMTGSMLTSYNKARTALEVKIDNKGWPDLLEKPTRLFMLCVALIGDNSLPWMLPGDALGAGDHDAFHRAAAHRAQLPAHPGGRAGRVAARPEPDMADGEAVAAPAATDPGLPG